jgi:O-antigen/teichoic acid export membrane protein
MVTDAKDAVIRHRVLRSTASNYVAKSITLITWFLLTPFILHRLGETTYGLWVLVGSVVAYGTLFDLGITPAIIKYVAEYYARGQTKQARSVIATALCFYSVLGLVVIAVSAAVAPVFSELFNVPPTERATATWLVLLMGLGIGISLPCTTPMAVLQGLQRFDLANLTSVITTFLSAAVTVGVLFLGQGILGMVAVNIAVIFVTRSLAIWFVHRSAPELRFGWRGARRRMVREVISFSSSLFVMDAAGRLQTRTDEIVIAAFLPLSAVTPFALSRRLSEAAQILADQFIKVLMPLASELHAEYDQARLRSLYLTGTRLALVILLPVGCALVIFARPILTLWVGPAYADYAHLVFILTLACLVDTSQWPAGSILKGMGRHRPLAVISVFAALANLALSIALVRRFGLTGVAFGTLLPAIAASLGFVLPYVMRVMSVSVRELLTHILVPTLLPAIPMVILVYVSRQVIEPSSLFAVVVVAGIGVLLYGVGYLYVGASDVELRTYRSLALRTVRFAGNLMKEACNLRII